VHRESMSKIVQRDATIYSFIIFLQTALHVSGDTLIHHQEHIQTLITAYGTGRTVFATVRFHSLFNSSIMSLIIRRQLSELLRAWLNKHRSSPT